MPAGTSVAISDAVGSQAVTISKAGLRCSGNDLRPAAYGEKSGLAGAKSPATTSPAELFMPAERQNQFPDSKPRRVRFRPAGELRAAALV